MAAALALSGCGGNDVTSNVVVPDAVLANASADVGQGARYRCTDGREVRAEFADPQTLTLHMDGRAVLMQPAATGRGVRFIGGGLLWSVRDLTRVTLARADGQGRPVAGSAVACKVG